MQPPIIFRCDCSLATHRPRTAGRSKMRQPPPNIAKLGSGAVDIPVLIWYIRALEVEGMAFLSALRFLRIPIRSIEEDAACRFSSAITTSIKPSRR
jgi:hypothetical protein